MSVDHFTPYVSVIFPTRNRKAFLEEALRSLTELTYPKGHYEVIVVDDGSTDGTADVVQTIKTEKPGMIRFCQQRQQGITVARNTGISYARGDVLVFTDDDCTFSKDWLQRLLAHFDAADVGAVGGPDQAPADSPFLARCVDYTVTSFLGTGGVRRKEGRSLAKYYPRGCNMAVPRAVIEKVGGFDESLAAGEEIELGYRIRAAGYRLKYAAEACVWHKRRQTLRAFLEQIFTRGYTRVELVRRHADLLEPAYLVPPFMVGGGAIWLIASCLFPYPAKSLPLITSFCLIMLLVAGLHGARRVRDYRALLVIPLLLTSHYAMYGLGFWKALWDRRASL